MSAEASLPTPFALAAKLAEEIAGQLTEKILESMKSQDTRNGYKQEAKG